MYLPNLYKHGTMRDFWRFADFLVASLAHLVGKGMHKDTESFRIVGSESKWNPTSEAIAFHLTNVPEKKRATSLNLCPSTDKEC